MEKASKQSSSTSPNEPFGNLYIVHPKSEHTHTMVMLHGRGSTGEEFAKELFASTLSDMKPICAKLPGSRWVFPSSREVWSTTFEEHIPMWFEACSPTDIPARQGLQVAGIRESVNHIQTIIKDEIRRLDGKSENLVLGGISQGGAIGMWTLLGSLCQQDPTKRLGAFVGASTWLPFAPNIDRVLSLQQATFDIQSEVDSFVETTIAPLRVSLSYPPVNSRFSRTAVFMGHGIDDAYVDIELGRQAAHTLKQIRLEVEWKEYSGAEEEGHWFKVPEEMDDIHGFLVDQVMAVRPRQPMES